MGVVQIMTSLCTLSMSRYGWCPEWARRPMHLPPVHDSSRTIFSHSGSTALTRLAAAKELSPDRLAGSRV